MPIVILHIKNKIQNNDHLTKADKGDYRSNSTTINLINRKYFYAYLLMELLQSFLGIIKR